MIKKKIMKFAMLIVAGGVLTCTLSPIKANAAWMQSGHKWWYSEGDSWAVGWKKVDGKWYYFDEQGYMKTGWLFDGSNWYYLRFSGEMITGHLTLNGKGFDFDGSGKWIENSDYSNNSNSINPKITFNTSSSTQTTNVFGDQVADSNTDEGHSISEVVDKWNELKPSFSENNIFDESPSVKVPYKAGKVKRGYLNDTLNYVNFARYLANVEPISLDSELTDQAQHGAVLTAANDVLEHTNPKHPSGMSNDFYELGKASTSSSNLSGGNLLGSVQLCLNDDANLMGYENIGHREWLLDPKVGKMGFGTTSDYSVQNLPFYDFEKNADEPDYISWPSQGAFPNKLISRQAVWSIDLNKDVYDINDDVKVRVTRLSDNKKWNLKNVGEDGLSRESTGFEVLSYNPYGYGSKSNTILFHISNDDLAVQQYLGKYKVEVLGLNEDIEYTINFFTLE
ncbi:CAP domain-containing protein [Clostridium saccharobutylicum]|uniref:Autolysin n=1 Tax=Clostridium saccharobutylicum TaxID=169679 RepID=A0A1S8NHS9_CLOSA|nr:CAP domain-containing protein [Clostridium saccharobutylicum]OOM16035.1 autolysin [Clostridium saccharobutylicum]